MNDPKDPRSGEKRLGMAGIAARARYAIVLSSTVAAATSGCLVTDTLNGANQPDPVTPPTMPPAALVNTENDSAPAQDNPSYPPL